MIGILIEEQINQFHSFLLPILTKAIEKEGYQGVFTTQYLIDFGHKRIGGLFYHSCGFNH